MADRMRNIVDALAAIDYPGPVQKDDIYGDPEECTLCEARGDWPPDVKADRARLRYFKIIEHADECPWVLARQLRGKPYQWDRTLPGG